MTKVQRILHEPVENREVSNRVGTMREKGIPHGQVPKRFAGDPAIDPRYEKKYAEFNAGAYGLAAAGFADLDFIPDESPDFEVRSRGSILAYLEIVTVKEDDDARYDGLLQQINVALRRRGSNDAEFSAKVDRSYCEIILAAPPNKTNREAIVSEVVDLFANENMTITEPKIVKIDERYPLLKAAGAQYITVPSRGAAHISFRKPPQTFANLPVANVILARLVEKRATAAKYRASPLWLMMYCEVPGTDGALQVLRDVDDLEFSPFTRVFIGGQRRVLELRDDARRP